MYYIHIYILTAQLEKISLEKIFNRQSRKETMTMDKGAEDCFTYLESPPSGGAEPRSAYRKPQTSCAYKTGVDDTNPFSGGLSPKPSGRSAVVDKFYKRVRQMSLERGCPIVNGYQIKTVKKNIGAVVDVIGGEKYQQFLNVVDRDFVDPNEFVQFKPTIRSYWDLTDIMKVRKVLAWKARTGDFEGLSERFSRGDDGAWRFDGHKPIGWSGNRVRYEGGFSGYFDDSGNPIKAYKLDENGNDKELIWER